MKKNNSAVTVKMMAVCSLLTLLGAGISASSFGQLFVIEASASELNQLGSPEEAWWQDDYTAKWKTVKSAKEYQVRLFENGEAVVRLNVSTNQLDLRQYMRDGYDYYFAVRAIAATGEEAYKKDGEWTLSSDQKMATQGITDGRWKNYLEGNKYMLVDGTCLNAGWANILGKWYYFQSDGYTSSGWIHVGTEDYYLSPADGVMLTGWQKLDESWYYFAADGNLVRGWIEDQPGHWYYLNDEGSLTTASWVGSCYVDENGLWIP